MNEAEAASSRSVWPVKRASDFFVVKLLSQLSRGQSRAVTQSADPAAGWRLPPGSAAPLMILAAGKPSLRLSFLIYHLGLLVVLVLQGLRDGYMSQWLP